jgi:hypothetical protein
MTKLCYECGRPANIEMHILDSDEILRLCWKHAKGVVKNYLQNCNQNQELNTNHVKKLAEEFWNTEYKNKWRGSTMKAIVVSSFFAGYKQGVKQ